MTRNQIVEYLTAYPGTTLVEVVRFFGKTGEHGFVAHWISDGRPYCGICGQDKARACGHNDGGLHSQTFVAHLSEWSAQRQNVVDSRGL